ncbi:hypothetical protein REPUB_Repub08aG0112600 [Reevesia pubescens]
MPERPKRLRMREAGETCGHKLSKRDRKVGCKKCFHLGHNSTKCPNNNNQNVSNISQVIMYFIANSNYA